MRPDRELPSRRQDADLRAAQPGPEVLPDGRLLARLQTSRRGLVSATGFPPTGEAQTEHSGSFAGRGGQRLAVSRNPWRTPLKAGCCHTAGRKMPRKCERRRSSTMSMSAWPRPPPVPPPSLPRCRRRPSLCRPSNLSPRSPHRMLRLLRHRAAREHGRGLPPRAWTRPPTRRTLFAARVSPRRLRSTPRQHPRSCARPKPPQRRMRRPRKNRRDAPEGRDGCGRRAGEAQTRCLGGARGGGAACGRAVRRRRDPCGD